MNAGNGHVADRAQRRRVANNTPTASGAGAGHDALAKVIGESVALHLANILGQILPQMRPQGTACLFCALAAKQALAAYTVACENAQAAAEDIPRPPEPPIQQAFTWSPVAAAPDVPPVAAPVCFDHLPVGPTDVTEQAPAERKAPFRPVGLVTPDGRQILTPNE